jgi:hypothetical protein
MRHRFLSLLFVATIVASLMVSVFPVAQSTASAAGAVAGYSYGDGDGSTIIGPSNSIFTEDNSSCQSYTGSDGTSIIVQKNSKGNCLSTSGYIPGKSVTCTKTCTSGSPNTPITIALPLDGDAQYLYGSWVDHSQIQIAANVAGNTSNVIYTDSKIDGASSNDALDYVAPTVNSGCSNANFINDFTKFAGPGSGNTDGATSPSTANDTAILHIYAVQSGTGNNNCIETDQFIKFINPQLFSDFFAWQDAGTISTTDAATVFVQSGSSWRWKRSAYCPLEPKRQRAVY